MSIPTRFSDPRGRAGVVCSILESSPEAAREALRHVPAGCDLVEIRGDRLTPDELCAVVGAGSRRPLAPLATLATLRSTRDGGGFDGSEQERVGALRSALAAGATFVDAELDSAAEALVEESPGRVVLSHHGATCRAEQLDELYRRMAASRAAVLKIVPAAASVSQLDAVRRVLRIADREARPLACFAMGRPGAISRLLAPSWGSWATYGAVAVGAETAPGQFTAADLLEVHRVMEIGSSTRRFALIGSDLSRSPSPAMHAAGHLALGLDARYFPIELDDLDDADALVEAEGPDAVEGLAVTMPFKEVACARCARTDEVARSAGAVNTVLAASGEWVGHNTDGPAILDLVRRTLEPAGARVAVVGAGGTALAAAAVLGAAGAHVTLFNRTLDRARLAAERLGVDHAALPDLRSAAWDVLIQATPLGKHGETIVPEDCLRGRVVVDAVYVRQTPLVAAARRRGLTVVDGFDLLVAQAVLQFELMTGVRPEASVLRDAGARWVARTPQTNGPTG